MAEQILTWLGKLYLHLRFREAEQVQRELRRKYGNAYRNAGLVLLFDLLMALAVVAFVVLFAALLYLVAA